MRDRWTFAVLVLGILLVGCPAGKSAPPAGSAGAVTLTFANEAAILAADATQAPIASSIAALGADRRQTLSMRLVAVKKLEEQAPASAVVLADNLLESPFHGRQDETLRAQATEVLVAIGTPDAQAALERGKKNNLDVGILAARLTRQKEGK